MQDIYDIIVDKTITHVPDEASFTRISGKKIQQLIRRGDFADRDSEIIFQYLYSQIEFIPFCSYLKRYLYKSKKMTQPFSSVPDADYKKIILDSFEKTGTPKSFHQTSMKFGTIVNGWLSSSGVGRESVFLLGFGLFMSVEDVSMFLTKAIHEQDFDFTNAEEVIYWYCLKKHYPAIEARGLIKDYYAGKANYLRRPRLITTKALRNAGDAVTEEMLWHYLRCIGESYSVEQDQKDAAALYEYLMFEAKKVVESVYAEDFMADRSKKRKIRDADVEKVLYNGIPVDSKGNLFKASLSKFQRGFIQYRLTRQRMSGIASGKVKVSRYDLMTLEFFLVANQCEDMPVRQRYQQFVNEVNEILKNCHMGELNISNPYEAFLLLCLLTEWPMAAFSEVWELGYQVPLQNG